MTIAELLLLLLFLAVAAGGAYFYMQRRDRGRAAPVSPYAEGLRAILDGDAPRAMQKMREVVSADTSNVDAYIRLGQLLAAAGDTDRALKVHRSLTFRGDLTVGQKIEVYRALATDYLLIEDVPRALETLEHLLTLSKKDRWALERKAELLIGQQKWTEAFETAQKLLAAGGQVTTRRLAVLKTQEGLRLCALKKERDGRVQFREAVKFDGTFIAPYMYWGDSYIREDRTEDAVRIWRRLISVNPAQAHVIFSRLESHLFDLGRFSEIEQIYRLLIRSYPQNVHAYAALSRFLDKRGDRGDAAAVLLDGLQHNADSIWLRRMLIQLYGDAGDSARVLAVGRDILTRVLKEQYEYTCAGCGHVTVEPLWLCPHCTKLDSFNV